MYTGSYAGKHKPAEKGNKKKKEKLAIELSSPETALY
jgi:hypothetical protein